MNVDKEFKVIGESNHFHNFPLWFILIKNNSQGLDPRAGTPRLDPQAGPPG